MPRRPFTADEDALLREDYAAYVPTIEIARKLGRDEGTLRQHILHLNLHRSNSVSKCLAWAPPHLRARLGQIPDQAFIDACYAWRDQQRNAAKTVTDAEREAHSKMVQAQCAEIDGRHDLTRRQKIMAKRMAGMTLQEIGDQHGITRERVRQLTDTPEPIKQSSEAKRVIRNVGRPPGKKNRPVMERLAAQRDAILTAEFQHLCKAWELAAPEVKADFLRYLQNRDALPAEPVQRNFNFFPEEDAT